MSAIRKSILRSPAGLFALMVALAASLLTGQAFAIDIPRLKEISPAIAEANPALVNQRSALLIERKELRTRTQAHDSECDEVLENDPKLGRCTQALQALTQDVERHVEASKRFNAALENIIKSASSYMVMPVEVRGEVYAVTADGNKIRINEHSVLTIDTLTSITTSSNGKVEFLLPDETVFTIGPNGEMTMDSFVFDPKTSTSILTASIAKGSFHWTSAKITGNTELQKKIEKQIKLGMATLGIRGTEFEGTVSEIGTGYVKLFSGELLITPKDSSPEFILRAGQMVRFTHGKLEPPEPIPASG